MYAFKKQMYVVLKFDVSYQIKAFVALDQELKGLIQVDILKKYHNLYSKTNTEPNTTKTVPNQGDKICLAFVSSLLRFITCATFTG